MRFSRPIRIAGVALLALALTHCANTPDQSLSARVDRERQLRSLNNWQMRAKLGVRGPEDSGSASFLWRQWPARFRIQMSGPLGQGKMILRGGARGASLERAGEPTLRANSPQQLLYQTTGWQVPLSQLVDWVRGLPAENLPAQAVGRDERGFINELYQGGWHLTYGDYRRHDGLALPERIVAERGEVRLVLAIHDWDLTPDDD